MVRGDPVVAGQRYLETPTQAGAVDGCHDRFVEGFETAHRLLPLEAQSLGFGLTPDGGEFLDVRAGNEGVGLARDQHHRTGRGVLPQPTQQRLQFSLHGGS